MTTIEQDSGEFPVLEDLYYGRHSAGVENRHEALNMGRHDADNPQGLFVSAGEVVRRLRLERLSDPEPTPAPKRFPVPPIQVARPFWDTATPEGILLKPYRPGKTPDPDATIGFIPLNTQGFPTGADIPTRSPYVKFKYDEPPIGHETGAHPLIETRVGDFAPVDTRVKHPPLWKQALIGLGLMKGY